jgi:hypothetical protein
MARPGRPERNRAARSCHQLRRFRHIINSDEVFGTHNLIDLDHAVIVEVEASSAVRQAEIIAAKTMITRAHDRFDLQPLRLAADTGYGSAEMLDWLVNKEGIEPESKR